MSPELTAGPKNARWSRAIVTTFVVLLPTAPSTSGPVVYPVANAPMFPNGASSGWEPGVLQPLDSAEMNTAQPSSLGTRPATEPPITYSS